MSFLSILTALDTKLQAVNDVPEFTSETNTTKLKGGSYARSKLLPQATVIQTVGLNGLEMKNGKYQVDLIYKNPSDYLQPLGDVDKVIAAFSKGLDLFQDGYQVTIQRSYPITVANNTPGYFQTSLIIEWECWV